MPADPKTTAEARRLADHLDEVDCWPSMVSHADLTDCMHVLRILAAEVDRLHMVEAVANQREADLAR